MLLSPPQSLLMRGLDVATSKSRVFVLPGRPELVSFSPSRPAAGVATADNWAVSAQICSVCGSEDGKYKSEAHIIFAIRVAVEVREMLNAVWSFSEFQSRATILVLSLATPPPILSYPEPGPFCTSLHPD